MVAQVISLEGHINKERPMFDVKKAKEEAEKEIAEERTKKAKELIKSKLRQIDQAKQILTNLERELDDLYADIGRQVL